MNIELSRFDFEHPHAWALASKFHSDWVRQVASKYEVNLPTYMLGSVLATIVGDDSNCFGIPCAPFKVDMAQMGKEHLAIRMKYEIDLPETPAEIRRKLEDLFPEVIQTNWQNEESFVEIRTKWWKEIKNFVEEEISEKEEYRKALTYSSEINKALHQEYEEFLYSGE